jgi:hypothetical protein
MFFGSPISSEYRRANLGLHSKLTMSQHLTVGSETGAREL